MRRRQTRRSPRPVGRSSASTPHPGIGTYRGDPNERKGAVSIVSHTILEEIFRKGTQSRLDRVGGGGDPESVEGIWFSFFRTRNKFLRPSQVGNRAAVVFERKLR